MACTLYRQLASGSDEATFVTMLGRSFSPPTHALGAATFAPSRLTAKAYAALITNGH